MIVIWMLMKCSTVCCIKNRSDRCRKLVCSALFSPQNSRRLINNGCHCHNRRSSFSMTQRRGSFVVFCSPLMMPVLWLTHRSVFVLLMLSPFNIPDFGRTLQSYSIVAHLDPPGGRRFNPSISSRRVCADSSQSQDGGRAELTFTEL